MNREGKIFNGIIVAKLKEIKSGSNMAQVFVWKMNAQKCFDNDDEE